MSDGEEVGYKKPPKKHRFKPGRSGNPGGRKKGTKNMDTRIREAINAKIVINKDGQRMEVSIIEAMLAVLTQIGLKGNMKAIDRIFDFAMRMDQQDKNKAEEGELSTTEKSLLESYDQRVIARYMENPIAATFTDGAGI